MKTFYTKVSVLSAFLILVSLSSPLIAAVQSDSVFILNEHITTSLCSGELYDSGGPDGDYSPFEYYTFTIELNEPSCVELVMLNFDLGAPGTVFNIYDAPTIFTAPIATLGSGPLQFSSGVSMYFYASSGSLTIEFYTSSQVASGFHARWECYALPCKNNPLETNANATVAEIEEALSGPGTLVTVDTIICADVAYATFYGGDNSNLGISKGVILTTGRVENLPGGAYGVSNPASLFASTSNGFPGDQDLDISTQSSTASLDACVMILDVVVAGEELSMEYAMGSEEYLSFVGTGFRDAMAIFVSGPSIEGAQNLNNQLNLATLPAPANPGTFISINSVNPQTNSEFYRDNQLGTSIVYNGLTSDYLASKPTLTASTPVIPCNHYKVKMVIADYGDSSYDSGLFVSEIRSGSSTALLANAQLEFLSNNGINYLSTSCSSSPDQIAIQLDLPQASEFTYSVTLSGNAILNEDYTTNLPASITFNPGETELLFDIEPLPAAPSQEVKTIQIYLQQDFGCGILNMDSLSIDIHSFMNVSISGVPGDSVILCDGESLSLQASGASAFLWEPDSLFSDPGSAVVDISPNNSLWIVLHSQTGTCTQTDSVFIEVVTPEVHLLSSTTPEICVGQSLELSAINNVENLNISWFENGTLLEGETNHSIQVAPTENATYSVSVGPQLCSASDDIQVLVEDYAFPDFPFTDTTICVNSSVFLGAPLSGSGAAATVFTWSPATGLSCTDCPNPITTLAESVTYTLTGSSENNFCSDTATISVLVENTPCGETSPWGHPEGSELAGILLGQVQLNGVPVEADDWIAAFDEDGNLAGANKVLLADSTAYLSLLIYGDDPITPTDEGINDLENFTLALYQNASDQTYTFLHPGVELQFTEWMDTGGTPMPAYNSLHDLYNFLGVQVDTIPLKPGWNMISTDVIPLDSTIQAITQGITPGNLQYITGFNQNGANFFDPNGPPFLNTLQNFERGFGYQIKVNQADTLFVHGFPIDSNYFKPMQAGWNLVAYLPQHPQSPSQYFNQYIQENNLLYVSGQTSAGSAYYTPNGLPFLNSLQLLYNSRGYWLQLLEGDNVSDETAGARRQTPSYPNQYQFIGGTSNLPEGALIDVLNSQSQIIATIEVLQHGLLKPKPVYISPHTGPEPGSLLRFRHNHTLANQFATIQGDYNPIRMHLSFPAEPNTATSLVKLHVAPNPFSQSFSVMYDASQPGHYVLELRDSRGSLVAIIDEGYKETGEQIVPFEAGTEPQGVYWISLFKNGSLLRSAQLLKID